MVTYKIIKLYGNLIWSPFIVMFIKLYDIKKLKFLLNHGVKLKKL